MYIYDRQQSGPRRLRQELSGAGGTSLPYHYVVPGRVAGEGLGETVCPGYKPGEVQTSRTERGHLAEDVSQNGRLLIADFGVDWRGVKDSTRKEKLLQDWLRKFETDTSYRLRILGYSDCVGPERNNEFLRRGRAERVYQLLGRSAQTRVIFKGAAPLGTYVADNGTVEGRAKNRGVVIEFSQQIDVTEGEEAQGRTCGRYAKANSYGDYVFLLMCAERALPKFTPRQMLSLLRQLYYGHESWSMSQSDNWPDVIPCGLKSPDPKAALGEPLYKTLRDSKVVKDTDMGHVFTGLEAMFCPSPTVEIEIPGPNWTVKMPNLEFATWGGDLGSAAAQKVYDEADRGMKAQGWSRYFGGRNTLASDEDLNGDIDSYIIGSGLTRLPCAELPRIKLTTLSKPVSQIFHEYYVQGATPFRAWQTARIACFIRGLGGEVDSRGIRNFESLINPIANRVFSFAEAYYKLKFKKGYFATPGIGAWLRGHSEGVTREFLRWLQLRWVKAKP